MLIVGEWDRKTILYNILTWGLSCVAFKYNCSDICRSFICLEDKKKKKWSVRGGTRACAHNKQRKTFRVNCLSSRQKQLSICLFASQNGTESFMSMLICMCTNHNHWQAAVLPEGVSGVKNNVELVRLFPEGLSVQLCCLCVPTSRRVQLSYEK